MVPSCSNNMEIDTKIKSLAILEPELWPFEISRISRRIVKLTIGDLEHFGLEFRNVVFTIVFLDPENQDIDTSPMFPSILVLEIP